MGARMGAPLAPPLVLQLQTIPSLGPRRELLADPGQSCGGAEDSARSPALQRFIPELQGFTPGHQSSAPGLQNCATGHRTGAGHDGGRGARPVPQLSHIHHPT